MSLLPSCTVCAANLSPHGQDTRCERCSAPCPTCRGDVMCCPHPLQAAFTDAELIEYAASFREGLLGDGSSIAMCAAVSWPLAGLLRAAGLDCEAVESDLSETLGLLYVNHVWLRLADGRALDATADQFNPWGYEYPPVYLGPPTEIHGAAALSARAAA